MNKKEKIAIKNDIMTLILGFGLIILALPISFFFLKNILEPGTELIRRIIMILVGSFFSFIPAYIGIGLLKEYKKASQVIRNKVKKYGEQNLLSHILKSTVGMYKNNAIDGCTVYFTDKFVIDCTTVIIDYNEISLMYKHVSSVLNNGVPVSYIRFELLDGSRWILCRYIKDEEITNYMQLCYQHNPKIMLGYTKENIAKHKERVKQYKSGSIVLPEITLDIE